jgi:Na+/H+ antiporter NhaD/arsenite permease-like protein
MDIGQILAIVIFAATYISIIVLKVHRMVPALVGAAATIVVLFLIVQRSTDSVFNVLNLDDLWQYRFWIPDGNVIQSSGVSWQTIVFIGGMMIMIEGLSRVGLFRWLCLYVTKITHARVNFIFVSFMLLSAFLSMFISSITVMLFLAATTIELGRLLKFDPVPMIIAEIFSSNVGGAATMCGDPPSIIIGTSLGLTFIDFVKNTGLIAWAGMIVSVVFFYIVSRRMFNPPAIERDGGAQGSNELACQCPKPRSAITGAGPFIANSIIFLLLIALLVTNAQTGLSLAIIAVIIACLSLIVAGKQATSVLKQVDWRTLLFLFGLFVCVGGLEQTGILTLIANFISKMSRDNTFLLITAIFWTTCFSSFIVDNIPLAAIMVPVISHIALTSTLGISTLAWTTSLSINIGGNSTPIGASANVVATAIAEKEGVPIRWSRYCKYAIPATLIVGATFWGLLLLRYL